MEGGLEDFPTFFSVRENIAWTSERDVIGWPPDSRGMWVVFAFSGSSHHLPETEVADNCEFRNGLEFGGHRAGSHKIGRESGNAGTSFRRATCLQSVRLLGLLRRGSRCYGRTERPVWSHGVARV